MVKTLLCEGVEVYKSAVAFVFTIRWFYSVEVLNFEGLFVDQQCKGLLAWRNLKWRFVCRLYGKEKALWYKGSSS